MDAFWYSLYIFLFWTNFVDKNECYCFLQLNLVQHTLFCPREDTAPYTVHIEAKLVGLIQHCTWNSQFLSSSCKELSTKTCEIKGKCTCQKIMMEQGHKKHGLQEWYLEVVLKYVLYLESDTNLSVRVEYSCHSLATSMMIIKIDWNTSLYK